MSGKKLSIYSDKSLLRPGERHEMLFYPFWGKNAEKPLDPNSGRFDFYQKEGGNYLEMTDLVGCDAAVLPFQWRGMDEPTRHFITRAREAGKPVVIFFNHDSDEKIPITDGVIFRTSFYASKRQSNEYAMPGWSEDFVQRYFGGSLPLRERSDHPIVGYCGYAADWKFRIKKLLGRPLHPGMKLRTAALDVLRRSRKVKTNVLIRSGFWAGAYKDNDQFDPAQIARVRREFVDNIAGSDYVLCTRGGGNFSYRLYETLSLGRIPVFVNTDCVLPYEKYIPWKEICVWVEESEIGRIDEKIAEFHRKLSAEAFKQLQLRNRQIWEEWISPAGFFKNLYRFLL